MRLDQTTRGRLSQVIAVLAAEYDGVFSVATVERVVADLLARLGPSSVFVHLPLLTERFARQRLRAAARADGLLPRTRPGLLFICVQNAGRSQMAAALARHVSEGGVEVMSAGSDPAAAIDGNVVTAMSELGIVMEFEFPKPLTDDVVRGADVVVTLGCDDACPVLSGPRYLDWHIADPAGRDLADVRRIRGDIANDVPPTCLKEIL